MPTKVEGEDFPVLSAEAILRLKADYEADVRLLEELPARIKVKRRKYEASLFFAPPGFDANSPPPALSASPTPAPAPAVNRAVDLFAGPPEQTVSPPANTDVSQRDEEDEAGDDTATGRVTWAGELRKLLDGSSRGLSHQEALEELKKTSLGERVSKGEKGFYNAVAFLEKRDALIKNGGLLYSHRLVAEMKLRGEELPDVSTEMRRRAGGSAALAMEVFRKFPDGLDANALRVEMGKLPGVSASVVKHGHYIYNVLGTLMGQGLVEKDAQGIYKPKAGV